MSEDRNTGVGILFVFVILAMVATFLRFTDVERRLDALEQSQAAANNESPQ